MANISPFKALRPIQSHAKEVATLPYDVCSTIEASQFKHNPYHFYHVTRSEIDLPEYTDVHSNQVYERAAFNLKKMINDGILVHDDDICFYIYEMTMNGRRQTGLVCGTSIQDYKNGFIKKHENTRPDKENDRINHIKTTEAQTGIIFLAYKDVESITAYIKAWKKEHDPIYDFIAEDGIEHAIWKINNHNSIEHLTSLFATEVPYTYIADGHHRSAALAKIAEMEDGSAKGNQYILSGLFPESELEIMDYNRIVKDLNGFTVPQILEKLRIKFEVLPLGKVAYKPQAEKEFGMYLDQNWYKLIAKKDTYGTDTLSSMDVNVLQENVLKDIFEIHDIRMDPRVDFVGGIRGMKALEEIVDSGEAAIAFACYPVTIQQLFEVADSGNVMPPKSTWFEPKTRDGLIVYLTNNQ